MLGSELGLNFCPNCKMCISLFCLKQQQDGANETKCPMMRQSNKATPLLCECAPRWHDAPSVAVCSLALWCSVSNQLAASVLHISLCITAACWLTADCTSASAGFKRISWNPTSPAVNISQCEIIPSSSKFWELPYQCLGQQPTADTHTHTHSHHVCESVWASTHTPHHCSAPVNLIQRD